MKSKMAAAFNSSRSPLLIAVFCLLVFVLHASAQVGVVKHDIARTADCYRLISSRNLEAAHLISPSGRYIHSWHFPQTDVLTSDFGGFGMTWHYAEMLPNGHLLAIVKDEMIVEIDWNSRLVWKAKLRAHHDFARTADGRTIVVSRRDGPHPWKPDSTIALDELVEFDREGRVSWSWHFEEHLDEIAALVKQPLPPHPSFKDWPHINTCEVLNDNPSGQLDSRFKEGNLLLCGRHSNTIFVVERTSGKVVWAWGPGELLGPHMPTMLANGNILIYDNGRHIEETARGYSRIIELNPITGKMVWLYKADPPGSFYSPSRGSAERLKNGNTLIAESDSGRLFEVTQNGDLVWEFWNSDLTRRGGRMSLYRTIPYNRDVVEPLLDKYGRIKDVNSEHQETLKYRKLSRDDQYKQYIREVVFWTEIGYFDHAFRFLELFMKTFPDDPEGFFAYALVSAAKKDATRSFEYMKKAVAGGLPLSRFTTGLNGLLEPLMRSRAFDDYVNSANQLLVHGPLLGGVSDRSALIWLRTMGRQSVQVMVRPAGSVDFNIRSQERQSDPDREFTSVATLDNLKPDAEYEYRLQINGQQQGAINRFRTYPEQGKASHFLTGFGGGAGYTPKNERMWDTLHTHTMPFFLLLGDNVYIDHPERPAVQKYCYYRRQSRPEFSRFAAETALYAIWDDHDFTHDDGKGSPDRYHPPWKYDVWKTFRNQWNNPTYGGGEKDPGCWTWFSYGDIDFFLLDCRYYREKPKGNPSASMLGPVQKVWLLRGLRESNATFKVIASSVPWAEGSKPGSLDTWDGHPHEREEIFGFIEQQRIEGVVLLSADRHRSDAWRIRRPGAYDLFEFSSSKLTNIHTHKVLPDSLFGYNKTCSVGLLEFDTTLPDPQLVYRIVTIDNNEIWRLTINRSQLSFKK